MTVICASIYQDGIVLGSDGLAMTDDPKRPIITDFQKLYPIGNNIFFGICGNNIYYPDINAIKVEAEATISYKPPYNLSDICNEMAPIIKRLLAYKELAKGFDVGFLVCGYDRDRDNKATIPHVYSIERCHKYRPHDALNGKEMATIGTVPVKLPPPGMGTLDLRHMPEGVVVEMTKTCIRIVHQKYPDNVGGTGRLVAIRKRDYTGEVFDTTVQA